MGVAVDAGVATMDLASDGCMTTWGLARRLLTAHGTDVLITTRRSRVRACPKSPMMTVMILDVEEWLALSGRRRHAAKRDRFIDEEHRFFSVGAEAMPPAKRPRAGRATIEERPPQVRMLVGLSAQSEVAASDGEDLDDLRLAVFP